MSNVKWLPYLENSIPYSVKGYATGFYSIALEAWRRGISVKFINRNRSKSNVYYELSYKGKSHLFTSSRGDLTSRQALRICRDKHQAKEYLYQANVPTPEGKLFEEADSDAEIIKYAKKRDYPLVIKPVDGTGGNGVIAGIQNEEEFIKSLQYVKYDLGFKNIIVEDHFSGEDLRVYVVDNEVVAVTKRIPANIMGNGVNTIRDLIKKKNKIRQKSPILISSLIKIDKELKQILDSQGMNLESVPEKGKKVFLKSKNNVSAGGDPIDITDELSDEIKQIAIDAVQAVPNLPNAGVDLMVNFEENKGVVIEINSQASIRTHLFPLSGQARNVPSKILDYYFPETTKNPRNNYVYFDFKPIWELFQSGKVSEYILPEIPTEGVELTRFIITGKVQKVNYGLWVRRNARDLKLNGYIRHLKSNQTSVVVSGHKASVNKFREILKMKNSKKSIVTKVEEKSRTTPVKLGFIIKNKELDRVIRDGYYPVRLEGISKLGRSKKRKSNKPSQKKLYKEELNKVYSSTSWKITKPLRKLSSFLKK